MKNILKNAISSEKKSFDEYEFLDEQQKIERQTDFMESVSEKLVIAYAVNCIFFAIPKLIRLFVDLEARYTTVFLDAILMKGIVFVLGYLGCRNKKYGFAIAGVVAALLNITTAGTNSTGLKRVYELIFESNIPFFFVNLVIACISIAVTIKYIGVQNHSGSAAYRMIDDKREFTEHMEKMERARKRALNEEKIDDDIASVGKTSASADLGAERGKSSGYMDEL